MLYNLFVLCLVAGIVLIALALFGVLAGVLIPGIFLAVVGAVFLFIYSGPNHRSRYW